MGVFGVFALSASLILAGVIRDGVLMFLLGVLALRMLKFEILKEDKFSSKKFKLLSMMNLASELWGICLLNIICEVK